MKTGFAEEPVATSDDDIRWAVEAYSRQRQHRPAPVMTKYDRPLANLYLLAGRETGQIRLKDGTARKWRPGNKNDWCR